MSMRREVVPMLERMTVRYVPGEDRLRITGAVKEQVVVIWLTQRLIRGVVPALVRLLDQEGKPPGDTSAKAEARKKEIMHGFAQRAARESMESAPAVAPTAPEATWLARSVRLASTPKAVNIFFEPDGKSAAGAGMSLAPRQLRQWMNILHDQCARAGWPTDVWPEWVRESAVSRKGSSGPLH